MPTCQHEHTTCASACVLMLSGRAHVPPPMMPPVQRTRLCELVSGHPLRWHAACALDEEWDGARCALARRRRGQLQQTCATALSAAAAWQSRAYDATGINGCACLIRGMYARAAWPNPPGTAPPAAAFVIAAAIIVGMQCL